MNLFVTTVTEIGQIEQMWAFRKIFLKVAKIL